MFASAPQATTDPAAIINDPLRLQAVRETGLLDTPPEEGFDRLTRLAARLTGASATFVSLVDHDRDFYKSHCGFGEPLSSERQLQGRTFCHYALRSDGPLVIEDTTADPVFNAVPTVQTLGVRAYVGVPLLVDGQVIGSFCAIDFAPRRWTAEDLDLLGELAHATVREIRLRRLANDANASAQQARQATRRHQETLAAVAHDLRTPLQVIEMSLQALPSLPEAERAAAIERSRRASDSMTGMVDDLLENSRLQDDRLQLQRIRIDAARLLHEATAMMTQLAQRRGVVLQAQAADDAGDILVDYQRMLRVFANLIGNAIKFSPAGSIVSLTLAREGGHCRFVIADQGPGIAADQLPLLFDRFWQGNDQDTRGAGLGLAIARSIVEAHDGTIGVDSTPAQGSRFHFRLPTAAAP